jgi:hypothetical protein
VYRQHRYRADHLELCRFFLPQCDEQMVKTFMDELFALHLELKAYRIAAGIPIRQMASPMLDPVEIKIGVSV